jgi:hypothetical protein
MAVIIASESHALPRFAALDRFKYLQNPLRLAITVLRINVPEPKVATVKSMRSCEAQTEIRTNITEGLFLFLKLVDKHTSLHEIKGHLYVFEVVVSSGYLLRDINKMGDLLYFVGHRVNCFLLCTCEAIVAAYAVRHEPSFADCKLVKLKGFCEFVEILCISVRSSAYFCGV